MCNAKIAERHFCPLRAAVEELLPYLEELAAGEPIYGHFHGGDPRNFSPDHECSTDEERAAHRAACEAWDRGERPDAGGPHDLLKDPETGTIVGWTTKAGFGLGVNTYYDETATRHLDALRAALEVPHA